MVKVGDKVQILTDFPLGAEAKIGEIHTVDEISGHYFYFQTPTGRWAGSLKNFDSYYKKVQSASVMEEPKKEETPNESLGKRYNNGKLRWRNFPMFLIEPLVQVAQYGETKYDTFNFLKGMKTNDSLDSLKRHLTAFEDPSQPDEDHESKVNHLAHVAWNALVCLYFLKTRPELDDRYKGEK